MKIIKTFLVLLLGSNVVLFVGCNSQGGGGQQPPASPSQQELDSLKKYAEIGKTVDSLYSLYISNASRILTERDSLNKEVPILVNIGEAYKASFRGEVRGQETPAKRFYSIQINRTDLAFYLVYLLKHHDEDLVASFGKYNEQFFKHYGVVNDPIFDRRKAEYRDQYGLIFGVKGNGADGQYSLPFFKNQPKKDILPSFYDDWHDGWPPTTAATVTIKK